MIMDARKDILWYIPNEAAPGHRGDSARADHNGLNALTEQALAIEQNGWAGALLGSGWARPDTFTVATALIARTTRFEPLIAIRPGYCSPAQFAASAATLDALSNGRVRINVVSGRDGGEAYGDNLADSASRYLRTREFMRLLRRLWTEENVDFAGSYYRVQRSTVITRAGSHDRWRHPPLYFGGASAAAEQVAAAEADVQLFWGEPLEGIAERVARLTTLSRRLDRNLPPLEFGLRITTVVRTTSRQAWADAEAKVAAMARNWSGTDALHLNSGSIGQQRLLDLRQRGEVLDDNLYTAPARFGAGGAATTWLVGSAEEVARSLQRYRALGVTHFVLSDTPYLEEGRRQGRELLPLLENPVDAH